MLKLTGYQFQCAAVASVGVIGLVLAVALNGYSHQVTRPLSLIRAIIVGASFAVGLYASVNALRHSEGIVGKTAFLILATVYAVFETGIIWGSL